MKPPRGCRVYVGGTGAGAFWALGAAEGVRADIEAAINLGDCFVELLGYPPYVGAGTASMFVSPADVVAITPIGTDTLADHWEANAWQAG